MRIFTRMIPGDPIVIWEQYHRGYWSKFIWDLTDDMLDIASWVDGQWKHTETTSLREYTS